MLDFFKRLFTAEPSSVTARERLRLVLLSDHLALAPDVVESLKTDLIAVISKYVDVDAANCDVTFEQQDRQVAMLANIPILGMKPAPKQPRPERAPEPPPMIDPSPASAAVADEPVAPVVDTAAETPQAAVPASKPRRRRRRRASVNAAPAAG
jgi:cell division topological specificity factor